MENELNKFITVFTCTYPSEAIVVKGRLQAEGIECSMQDELTVEAYSLYSNAIGGVKLQVKESDYDKAMEILNENNSIQNEFVAETKNETIVETSEKLICPNCGSSEVSKPRLSTQVLAISILLIGFPLPWMSKSSHCFDCGVDFKYEKPDSK